MIETGGGTFAGEGCVMLSADPLSLGKRAQRTRRSAKDALQVPASFYGHQPTQRILSGERPSASFVGTDSHWGNWGLLVDNSTNRPVSLHPLMDFNQAFHSYEDLDGANCQTVFPERMTQREAAVRAAEQAGLNQSAEIRRDWFSGREKEYEMLMRRLDILKKAEK